MENQQVTSFTGNSFVSHMTGIALFPLPQVLDRWETALITLPS